ncbi:MAG: hypothetical protein PSV40_15820 [Polaromonas sp.]|uniref:hypothetical protein n=1 Tax=Polaromonas sp. TaxID=1869339 RepID=UPI002488FEFD|nr:hypothetical protein [Polaromonas sp.]MDI1270556.1 hypothetical protein [Polaromonas sp.]
MRPGWLITLKCAFLFALVCSAQAAIAQCSNSATPSCDVYEKCFAKYCPCDGRPDEYFRSYGLKYCRAFLGNTALSPKGKAWRDSTLICLQEQVVPKLDISTSPSCNCGQMRAFAFESHVDCYTKPGASMCDLPASDLASIAKTVDLKDMFDAAGWRQMRDVAARCEARAPDDGRRSAWKAMAAALRLRSP